MTPIVNARPGTPEFNYTEAQMRSTNCIERCIGVLKARFRCLILHNICIDGNLEMPPNVEHEHIFNINEMQHIHHQAGYQARANLIHTYFQ